MKFWNLNDDLLIARLREEIHVAQASFEIGPEGGVAVYRDTPFLGVWIERVQRRYCYVPAARLRPTLMYLSLDQVIVATRSILADRPADRRPLSSTA